jgi:hypothetical protein
MLGLGPLIATDLIVAGLDGEGVGGANRRNYGSPDRNGIPEYEAKRYEGPTATDQSFAKSLRHWE